MGKGEKQDRIFISMPDTAMRLLELWSSVTGIAKTKLMEWAIRKLAEEQNKSEEEGNRYRKDHADLRRCSDQVTNDTI